MAHHDEPHFPPEQEPLDEWIEQTMRARPLQPDRRGAAPDPQLIQELQRFYQAEAQAVDRRLERVWQRLDSRRTMATRQSRQEPPPRALPVVPHRREYHPMPNPFSRLHTPQRWSTRLGALAAAVLLVALVGGLTAGIILVRHNGTQTQAGPTPTATAKPSPTPTPLPPSGNFTFSSLEMKDANTGWAVGYETPISSGEPEKILHTSDGGVHWTNVTPRQFALLAQQNNAAFEPLSDGASTRTEDFVSGSVAWVLSLPNHFFVTTDGGQTWASVTAPGDSLRQYTFLDARHGWVIAEAQGTVGTFKTTNGGATWTRVQSSGNAFPLQTRFWGVTFLNQTTGWAAFINDSAGSSFSIYVTHNSGATWQLQQIALPRGAQGPIFLNPPTFFNSQEGMLEVMFNGLAQFHPQTGGRPASGGSPEALYFTHNGGASWDGPVILNGLEYPDFIDDQHGWALNGTGSALLTTSDGGQNWATVPTSANFSEAGLPDFVSSQVGWAFKYNDQDGTELLIKTIDGGHTWTQLNVPSLPN